MKNSNDTIGNRTRALPACSAVPLRHRVFLPYKKKAIKINTAQLMKNYQLYKA
jgi:hypothetical protein